MSRLFLLILIFSQTFTLAQHKMEYGNNPAAGKYYEVRGIKMYVEEYGKGKPVLLIHGNNGNISAFENNIPYFAKRYHVIATDSRSQGKSIDTNDSLSFEMMADDEAALLKLMHIDSAYVIGWSDGGIIAILLAMRHPKSVIKFASTGANLWPDSTAIDPNQWRSDKIYFDSSKNKTFPSAKEKNNWKLFSLDWFQPNITLKQLSAIKSPALIIAGDHDIITLEHTLKIYQNIPKAQLWIVPHSGHGTLVEHKEEFNTLVNAFFSK